MWIVSCARRLSLPLFAALAALAALAAALPATAHAGAVPPVRGIGLSNFGASTPLAAIDAELSQAKALGANTVRAEISWAALEPDAQFDLQSEYLARIDRLVAGARKRHMKPLLLLQRSPCWASSAPGAPGSCRSDFPEYPPRDAADFGSIAGRLAKRYTGRLAGIEVWNEPDHDQEAYFKGPDKPGRYAAVLKAAYRSINNADRRLPVIGGSLVGANGNFLKALYAKGIKGHYDGLAIHYYDLTLASIRAIHDTQRQHNDRKPLWLTEFGWTSCYPAARTEGEHACVTAKQQGLDLGDVFRALRGHSFIRAAVVYKLRDQSNEHFGVLRTDGSRKPSFAILRRAFTSGLPRPRGVTAHVSGGRLSGTAPAGDIVTVQGFHGKAFFYQAILAPDRFGRFSLKLPGAVYGSTLVVSQPWTGRKKSLRV